MVLKNDYREKQIDRVREKYKDSPEIQKILDEYLDDEAWRETTRKTKRPPWKPEKED